MSNRISVLAIVLILSVVIAIVPALAASVTGKIVDSESGESLPFVTVQVLGTGKATSANQDGHFRIVCDSGPQVLKFSHIGYYSVWDTLGVEGEVLDRQIQMIKTLVLGPTQIVYDRQYDPAQRIILEAIKRKKEILERLNSYNYNSYTKMVVRDLSKEDTAKIMTITETQAKSFWEKPDKYKEVIIARRQSANLEATDNLVSIGEFLNFNHNRLEIGRYSIVSPVAEDALDYYNYYLYDSTYIDNRKVYRLEAEPKNQADPLVAGYILIADSTYDIVGVDVGFNEGVRLPFVKDLRYLQRGAQFDNLYWMPVELKFTADVLIKFPGIPDKMGFEVAASIYDYSFEIEHAKHTFDEYVFEVGDSADAYDSARWVIGQTIPLTPDEQRGYSYLDSVQRAPKPFHKRAARVGLGAAYLATVGEYDIFHFNRVEGAYLGLGTDMGAPNRGLQLQVKSGYAFEPRIFEYRYGLRYQFRGRARLAMSGNYHRQVRQQWNINQDLYNSTFEALCFKYDPVDYYYERGANLGLELSPLPHFKITSGLELVDQRSMQKNTDYSLFSRGETYLDNAQIHDGSLGAGSASIEYDSRKLWRNKGTDYKMESTEYSVVRFTAELSSPDFMSSDFDYRKYYARISHRQRTLGLGTTRFSLFAGTSQGAVPRQKWYQFADYSGILAGEDASFMNLGDNRFVGDRAAYIAINHDFDQYLFKKSGLPLIKSLPFTLSFYVGAFWTGFRGDQVTIGETRYKIAEKSYREIGFSLGNLTPFLSVFNMAVYFSWQLSDYDVGKFVTRLGIRY